MIVTKCDYCGKELTMKPYRFNRAKRHFCDKECVHAFNQENGFWGEEHPYNYQGEVEVECSFCNKLFTIPAGQYNYSIKNRNGNFCCSRKCTGQFNKQRFSGENAHRFGEEGLKGELNSSWKGGITPFIKAVRLCGNYYRWKNKILERDNYKCQICNSDNNLVVHHKIPLIKIIKNNNINTMEEAKENKQLWDLENGITLCSYCHKIKHLDRSDYNGI